MRSDLVGASLETVANGFMALPRGPGLGITVKPEALERYKDQA